MIRSLSRREALVLSLGLPFLTRGAEAPEFWKEKKSADWSDAERQQVLSHSPWAREADVKFNGGPGPLGGPYGWIRAQPGGDLYGGNRDGTTKAPEKFTSIARWESALPVIEAERSKLKDDPAAHYILSLTGGVPMLGRHDGDTDDEYQTRLENLKQYTRLEKRGGPIYLVKVGDQPGKGVESGTRFYFERNDLISERDGSVTFITRLGPIDVKCKFPLKEMMYQGKLEL